MKPWGKRKALLFLGLLLLMGLIAMTPVWAAEGRTGDQVTVGPGEVIEDDLYVGAGRVTIDGTVKGDIVAFGQQVIINGTVEGDLIAMAQVVTINGTVGDDARIAGQALLLGPKAKVGDDVIAMGLSLEQKPGSTMEGDLLYAGYQALLAGTVGGDIRGGMGALELRGTVGGNVEVEVGGEGGGPPPTLFIPSPSPSAPIPTVKPGLTLGDAARIGGSLTYTSAIEGHISTAAQVAGEITRKEPTPKEKAPTPGPVTTTLNHLRRLIALLLAGLLLLWIAPSWTQRLADTVGTKPLPSLGWGVVAFVAFVIAVIAIPVVTLILAFILSRLTLGPLVLPILSLGFLADAALAIGFFISISYIAQIAVSFLGGRWLLGRVQPHWAAGRVLPLVVGLVLFVILRAIPLLGLLIGLIVALLGLGALWMWGWAALRPGSPEPSPAS